MVGRIDAGSGISVLVPSAAKIGVLLYDLAADCELAQLDSGTNSRNARADDHDMESRRDFREIADAV